MRVGQQRDRLISVQMPPPLGVVAEAEYPSWWSSFPLTFPVAGAMRMSTPDESPQHQRDGLDGLSPQPAHDPLLQVLELSRIVVGDMALNEVLTRVASARW